MNIDSTEHKSVNFFLGASRVMKTLGHPLRLNIIRYIQGGERTVTEIQTHLNLIQAVTSQHLRKLYKERIVTYRREGTTCYYSIANEFIRKILSCFSECEMKIQSGEWNMDEFGFNRFPPSGYDLHPDKRKRL